MTEYEADNLRTLLQAADLDHVPTTRDLIGPAVAWGGGRRRRDRWTAVGVAGAVAVVAATGTVALRPGTGTSGSQAVSSQSSGPVTTGSALVQRQLDLLRPYLPAGYRLDCQSPKNVPCGIFVLTSPTGATNMVQLNVGHVVTDSQSPYDPTPLVQGIHIHTPTAQLPLGDGTQSLHGGTLTIYTTDSEAQVIAGHDAVKDLTDPTEFVANDADYSFTPNSSTMVYSIGLSALVKDIPWKNGRSSEFKDADDRTIWGYSPTGPILTPEQFAKMASTPGFQVALKTESDMEQQAMQSEISKYDAQHSSAAHTPSRR